MDFACTFVCRNYGSCADINLSDDYIVGQGFILAEKAECIPYDKFRGGFVGMGVLDHPKK